MPVRLLMCLLLGGVAVEAQTNEQYRVPEMPNPSNLQDQRLNRAPMQRTRPSDYHLPATAPTTTAPAASAAPAVVATPAPVGAAVGVAETPSRRATVSYTAGQLSVSAANSSLNQILRDISRTAGITITGGVAEERVFGQYGPGTPAEVLNDLLDGTGSNMLYVQGSGGKSSELVLSTRTGGPTPPSPHSARFDAEDEAPAAPVAPPPPPPEQRLAGGQGDSQQPPPTDSSAQQPATTSSSDSSGDQSSSGAKTPQQIFDELMKLRQQQH